MLIKILRIHFGLLNENVYSISNYLMKSPFYHLCISLRFLNTTCLNGLFCRKLGHFESSSICKIFNLIFTASTVRVYNNQRTFAAFLLSFFISNSIFGMARSTVGGYTKIASNTVSLMTNS